MSRRAIIQTLVHVRDETLRIASVVLLGLAATTTGWAAYESAVWGARHSEDLAHANEADRKAITLELEANQARLLDVSVFEAYVNARLRNDDRAAAFYRAHFRPPFETMVARWLKERPFDPDSGYVPHPLEIPTYDLPQSEQSNASRVIARIALDDSRRADAISASYVLGTVIAAFVSLFAGLVEPAGVPSMRRYLLLFAMLAYAAAAIWIFSRPISLFGQHFTLLPVRPGG